MLVYLLAEAQLKQVLYDIGEPLVMTGATANPESGTFAAAEYLLDAMNFGAIREWMHLPLILYSIVGSAGSHQKTIVVLS